MIVKIRKLFCQNVHKQAKDISVNEYKNIVEQKKTQIKLEAGKKGNKPDMAKNVPLNPEHFFQREKFTISPWQRMCPLTQ